MDIKEKFMLFIDKQKISLKSPTSPVSSENVCLDEFEGRLAVLNDLQRRTSLLDEQHLTPEAEQAVIQSINPIYFQSEDVDVSEHELTEFPDIADVFVINSIRSKLRKQQGVVSRRVSNLIMQKQVLCSEEMEKISEIQRHVYNSIKLCVDGRDKLSLGRNQFTSASLGILANYSKRQSVASVIKSLRTIRTLQMTDVQLQSLLKAEDYPGAIQLLLECQKAAATFKHFTCISELSTKLQETLELAEDKLDDAVARVAANFNNTNYEKLHIAYGLLGKTQTMMDQLHMHLTSYIHNSAFTIVLGYVELYNTMNNTINTNGVSSFSKLQYSELCKYVNEECFLCCFLDLSKAMWNILRSYRNIIQWHEKEDKNNILNEDANENELASRHYIKQKLEHGLIRVWQDVQSKVRMFILASDLSHFKFDDFLRILDVINKLIEVGEAFCGSKSETLHESIKKQSISFFRNHHRARMEELHMFLENEGWECCPVKPTFTIYQLHEFRFLKAHESSLGKPSTPSSSPIKRPCNINNDKRDYFLIYEKSGSPFDLCGDDTIEEDIMANGELIDNLVISDEDSDDDVPEELKKDYVDEQTGETPHLIVRRKISDYGEGATVTNTTLTILRLIGKYIQMMKLLQPIAFDVMICLSQLFDYYLFAVFHLFGVRGDYEQNLSPRLRTALKRIQDNLILSHQDEEDDDNSVNKVPTPSLSMIVNTDSAESIYGLPVRVVAVESLTFLATQLETLQTHIEGILPQTKRTFLQQFYGGTVKITPEVRQHVYTSVAATIIDYDNILNLITSVKWDINDLMSQHSQYVDVLLRQLQIFSMRLEELSRAFPIPAAAYSSLWECIIKITNRTLLEGLSGARRCTNEGRSLMQLDYQQFLMKLEGLTTVRPIPGRHLVETYIKAYYLPENALEEWITLNHAQYTSKQLTALTASMSHVTKRTRQKINALLEENIGKKC